MNKKHLFYIAFCIFLQVLIPKISWAQIGDAGQPGEFLRYGVGARALGMGRAFTALSNDASAMYWNPAGLIGVKRNEFTTMYTNLFYDSRFTYTAIAIPRKYLGKEHAFGVAWVNMAMGDFDQRGVHGEELGQFDLFQQAFIGSFAGEIIPTSGFFKSWGILNYGISLKLINQALPGFNNSETGHNKGFQQGWGVGMDFGAIFTPINTPILKLIALRYLLPFKLGFSLQNLLSPHVGFGTGEKDVYPVVFRFGGSYRINYKNWKVNILYDQEKFSGRRTGRYAGFETILPYTELQPVLRLGFNNRTEKVAIGGGLRIKFAKRTAIRMDFAWSHQATMNGDIRLFFTLETGQNYNASYFSLSAKRINRTEKQKMKDNLQVIARCPNKQIMASAKALGGTYDTTNAARYYQLIGGLILADQFYKQAIREMEKNNINGARKIAKDAIYEYRKVFNSSIEKFTDNGLLNFAESLMMRNKWEMASDTVMAEVDSLGLQYYYQMGICYKNEGRWQEMRWSYVFFFKQKTAYEVYQCDWSSDVCSSDLTSNKVAEWPISP